jgi:uncharacterized membrane-anchored protein
VEECRRQLEKTRVSKPVPHSQLDSPFAAGGAAAQTLRGARTIARKVPEVTLAFWLIKLLTTAMGESTSDYLVHRFDPYTAVALGAIAFSIAIVLQFAARRYVPWVYWLAVAMVAVFGTMAADVLHIGLRIPYVVSSAFFAVALAVIFAVWYATEKTLSIHSIDNGTRELFYWATVITTFALGTATGDMTASTLRLGYLVSGLLFLALFAVPALGYRFLGWNEVFAFWFAYIVTRPIGASFADWFGRTPDLGGIGVGTGLVSVLLAILIVACVAFLTITRKDGQRDASTSRR